MASVPHFHTPQAQFSRHEHNSLYSLATVCQRLSSASQLCTNALALYTPLLYPVIAKMHNNSNFKILLRIFK